MRGDSTVGIYATIGSAVLIEKAVLITVCGNIINIPTAWYDVRDVICQYQLDPNATVRSIVMASVNITKHLTFVMAQPERMRPPSLTARYHRQRTEA